MNFFLLKNEMNNKILESSDVQMNNNEKSLKKINENSIFYKLKNFFTRFFNFIRKEKKENLESAESIESVSNIRENSKNTFLESIKNIENEETKLLKLQEQYRSGKIREEELSKEQVDMLCALYDKQISQLRKSNAILKNNLIKKTC